MGFQAESAGVRITAMTKDKKMNLVPSRQVIELYSNMENRRKAESRTIYHHYCKLSSLGEILDSKAFKLNCIANFTKAADYERRNIAQEFWGQVFVACLTTEYDSDDLWNDFGDERKGVRIDFSFPSIFHKDVFNDKMMIRSFDLDGNEQEKLGFSISSVLTHSFTCNPNYFTKPIVDISLSDIDYVGSINPSHVQIDGNKVLNITSVSTEVPDIYRDECETRVRGILRCTNEICMNRLSYLLVPIRLKYMSVCFGEKVCNEDIERYSKKLRDLQNEEKRIEEL